MPQLACFIHVIWKYHKVLLRCVNYGSTQCLVKPSLNCCFCNPTATTSSGKLMHPPFHSFTQSSNTWLSHSLLHACISVSTTTLALNGEALVCTAETRGTWRVFDRRLVNQWLFLCRLLLEQRVFLSPNGDDIATCLLSFNAFFTFVKQKRSRCCGAPALLKHTKEHHHWCTFGYPIKL